MLGCARLLPGQGQRMSCKLIQRAFSAEAGLDIHRTTETDPRLHNMQHLGRHYSVDPAVPLLFGKELLPKDKYYQQNYFGPLEWVDRCQKFKDTAIMVREPAVQVIQCINNSDLTKPANRYVLYGRPGCGKSISLAHIIHFGQAGDWVVLPFLNMKMWLNSYYEVAPSTFTPGAIDHVSNANYFLKNFKQANPGRLEKCVTHREYVWSVREKTPVGVPLMEVVDLGIERLPFAADALNVVLRELRINSTEGNCKTLVVCDGVNTLFSASTLLNKDHTTMMKGPYGKRRYRTQIRTQTPEAREWMSNLATVDECSVLKNIKKMLRNDYSGSAVVTSVDTAAIMRPKLGQNRWWVDLEKDMVPDTDSHLPFSLLGEEGWRTMDPFLPIEVLPYSEVELDSAIGYYRERGWLGEHCHTPAARQEIHFLTGRVPGDFFRFSSSF